VTISQVHVTSQEETERAEHRRAQEEVVRLRRLMNQGVITAEELQAELTVIGAAAAGAVHKGTVPSSKRASISRRLTVGLVR